ncbi:PREDICTED: protein ABA DEFICIENT 4, chloroplastic-like [Nelumbo nucifera]|uniref:Protein ABA DEFICIENT 4, chloroplastic-like n=2 Tax=Nelumbo nucifera TaxID=4432 RepID=A0A1U8ADU2_NELNU|nr:PREDICTED: protein ABA DEFICIENT 4, chloroplastic-like [Nelumbo nucifera]DAD31806.1 TPA_asm: hypothetical protein HUJ06_010657 [Nelumbo nucifera]
MAPSAFSCHSQISLKANWFWKIKQPRSTLQMEQRSMVTLRGMSTGLFGQQVERMGNMLHSEWSFIGGSRVVLSSKVANFVPRRKGPRVYASWLTSSQLASSVFTVATVAVLPFYTLMVLAPKAELTKRSIESTMPYVVLGLLYAYLLYFSWTPETIRFMFASKYWLPELSGIAKMFSSEMTLASAWIHLLAVDLFAARQVYLDGLENEIETRHSVSLCLLFCPIGIVTHVITKTLTKGAQDSEQTM